MMADITMCSSTDCPLETLCYRKTAIVNEYWQSYSQFLYDRGADGTVSCKGYYPDGIDRNRKKEIKKEGRKKKQ